MTARSRLSVTRFRHFPPTMGDAVRVSLPASEVPRTPAVTPGSAAGQRMRAIDTLLAARGLVPGPGEPQDMDPHLLLDGERRLRRSDGTELWVVQSHEIVRHSNGEPTFG